MTPRYADLVQAKMGSLYRPRITILLAFLLSAIALNLTEAFDPLDPTGNITIRWDILFWTPDGYVAVVNIYNFQKYRHVEAPGWSLGWTWAKKEVIWNMLGSQTTEQGDCLRFKGNIPHCCKKNPTVVDLLPGTPYNQQIANCCKGGVLGANAVSSFQLSVGDAGTSNETVRIPKNFTLKAPGDGYTCGPAKIVKPTKFVSPDKRRYTQALMTWDATCTYSQFMAHKTPTCCVSMSSFYNKTFLPCPTCSCGCRQANTTQPRSCVKGNTSYVASNARTSDAPLVQCTNHMCPIRVHWHVKFDYEEAWGVEITIANFNHKMNYSDWNLVVQHPNFDTLTHITGFNYKSATTLYNVIRFRTQPIRGMYIKGYTATDDTAMLWGNKLYNKMPLQAGPHGCARFELIFGKNKTTFSLEKGWVFPHRVAFDGDFCVMLQPTS